VINLLGGMSGWSGPREFSPGRMRGPSEWLLRQGRQLPPGGRALDAACGAGRHALVLAGAGYTVTAIDRDEDAIARLRATASRLGLPVEAQARDLEGDTVDLGDEAFDLIVGFRYLHRPLFPALVRALRPGGLLVYETFTRAHAEACRKPSNPAFLLEPGELARLVAPLEIVDAREGAVDGDHVASVAARKA
jgi:SAM-dependent methyltransferase